eukprot:11095845-Lingulodinium_polyedra.AAC.1
MEQLVQRYAFARTLPRGQTGTTACRNNAPINNTEPYDAVRHDPDYLNARRRRAQTHAADARQTREHRPR